MVDVALIAMPFGPLLYPSIALSLLQPGLQRRGYSCSSFYFLLDYAERVGLRFYNSISEGRWPPLGKLAGEWIFGGQLCRRTADDVQQYVADVLQMRLPGIRRTPKPIPRPTIERIVAAERDSGAFLDECVEKLLAARPRIVGLTSTFQQHAPALALAKRVNQADPSIVIVMGGPNCEGVMGAETCRQFPFVDAAVSGEGDVALPEIVRRVLAGESFDDMPGVRTQQNLEQVDNTPPILDLDVLPEVDYDDYLAAFRKTRFFRSWQPRLLFETSRGCWWGERHHCTFCGLNGATMKYRSKSPERALSEMQAVAKRYPGYDVDVTDNILDLRYFDTLLPALAKLRIKEMALFYETKANLRKEQVRMLRDAGIRRIQPGIESFSDTVLTMMRKGVSGLQNIQLLKWCMELGISAQWNLLVGFPGEPAEEYQRMTTILPLLSHLRPPDLLVPIRMDRFSPNFFDAEKLGFTSVEPFKAYAFVYNGLSREAIANLACFFRFEYRQPQDIDRYALPLRAAYRDWCAVHRDSALFFIDDGERLVIGDFRPVAAEPLIVLEALERRLYLACDAVTHVRALATALDAAIDDVEAIVRMLLDRGLILRERDRVLALAIPGGDYTPPSHVLRRFRRLIRNHNPSRQEVGHDIQQILTAKAIRSHASRETVRP
jgi:ribosomal peptide maturation radical SAM protein 1